MSVTTTFVPRSRSIGRLAAGALSLAVAGLLFTGPAAAQAPPAVAPPTLASPQLRSPALFQQRLQQASPQIKSALASLDQERVAKNWTFHIAYTAAMDRPLEQLAGTRAPENFLQGAPAQNAFADHVLELDRKAFIDSKVVLRLPTCVANRKAFSWRDHGKVTPVKNQGPCGSCWAFAAMGAYEGNYLIRNNQAVDTSEQDVVSCSGAGSCGGGWWAGAYQWLLGHGVAAEATMPYTATNGTCPASVSSPYRAIAWGYVSPGGALPPVPDVKQALCVHGPLAVAVRVTGAFQAYGGGVFNENAPGNINHGVTLIGWDDARQAWLIKNSWGTLWGEDGYMWIHYGSNSIGYGAAWVTARSHLYVLPKEIPFAIEKHLQRQISPFQEVRPPLPRPGPKAPGQ